MNTKKKKERKEKSNNFVVNSGGKRRKWNSVICLRATRIDVTFLNVFGIMVIVLSRDETLFPG